MLYKRILITCIIISSSRFHYIHSMDSPTTLLDSAAISMREPVEGLHLSRIQAKPDANFYLQETAIDNGESTRMAIQEYLAYNAEYEYTSEEMYSTSEKAISELKKRRKRNSESAARHRAKNTAIEEILTTHFKLSGKELRDRTPRALIDGIEMEYSLSGKKAEIRKSSTNKAQKKSRVRKQNSLDELLGIFGKLPQQEQDILNEKISQRKEELFQEYLRRKTE